MYIVVKQCREAGPFWYLHSIDNLANLFQLFMLQPVGNPWIYWRLTTTKVSAKDVSLEPPILVRTKVVESEELGSDEAFSRLDEYWPALSTVFESPNHELRKGMGWLITPAPAPVPIHTYIFIYIQEAYQSTRHPYRFLTHTMSIEYISVD